MKNSGRAPFNGNTSVIAGLQIFPCAVLGFQRREYVDLEQNSDSSALIPG